MPVIPPSPGPLKANRFTTDLKDSANELFLEAQKS